MKPENKQQENSDTNNQSNKNLIQITVEDYEYLLAGKVIQKSYKIILGILIFVGIIFGLFGFQYNKFLNESKTRLENDTEEFTAKYNEFINRSDSLRYEVSKLKQQKDMLEKHFSLLNNQFTKSSNSLFESFLESTKQSIETVLNIEQSFNDTISKLASKIENYEYRIVYSDSILDENIRSINEIKEIDSSATSKLESISNIIEDFGAKYNTEPVFLEFNQDSKFCTLINREVKFTKGFNNKSRNGYIIIINNDGTETRVDNLPSKKIIIDNVEYSVNIVGNKKNNSIYVVFKRI